MQTDVEGLKEYVSVLSLYSVEPVKKGLYMLTRGHVSIDCESLYND